MDAGTTSRDDIRRVLIAGDTHGNTAWVETLARKAVEQGCPIIIQVGDFGYFPDHPGGPRFLTAVDTACAVNGVEPWSIDEIVKAITKLPLQFQLEGCNKLSVLEVREHLIRKSVALRRRR